MTPRRAIAPIRLLPALLALFILFARPLSAQPEAPRFHGILGGVHGGNEFLLDGLTLGAQLQMMLDPWNRIYLMPSGEFEFRRGIRDWQMNADVAIRPYADFYVGGGIARRNSIFDPAVGRETIPGQSIIVGVTNSRPRPGALGYSIELRWARFEVEHPGGENTTLKPRWVTVALNYPLVLWR